MKIEYPNGHPDFNQHHQHESSQSPAEQESQLQNLDLASQPAQTMEPLPEAEAFQNPEAISLGKSELDTAHLEALAAMVSADEPTMEAPGVHGGAPPAPDVMPLDVFKKTFIGLFNFGGLIVPPLAIADDEAASADAAAEALYDSALEVEWLRPILHPGGAWLPRLMAIGMFGGMKLRAVKLYFDAKKAAQKNANASSVSA